MSEVVWTIGTGHRSLDEFSTVLRTHRIAVLVDVRSYPKSHLDHFDRDALESELADTGLEYLWLGDDLGGLRPGGFERHTTTARYARGLQRLERLARDRRVAVCCAEVDPDRCHRRFIADSLIDHGWRVIHLIEADVHHEHARHPRQSALPLAEE